MPEPGATGMGFLGCSCPGRSASSASLRGTSSGPSSPVARRWALTWAGSRSGPVESSTSVAVERWFKACTTGMFGCFNALTVTPTPNGPRPGWTWTRRRRRPRRRPRRSSRATQGSSRGGVRGSTSAHRPVLMYGDGAGGARRVSVCRRRTADSRCPRRRGCCGCRGDRSSSGRWIGGSSERGGR